METSEIEQPMPAEVQQQLLENNGQTVGLQSGNCSMSEKVENFAVESKIVIQNSVKNIKENIAVDTKEVNNLSSSFENQTLQEEKLMELEDSNEVQVKDDSLVIDKANEVTIYFDTWIITVVQMHVDKSMRN